MCDRRSAMLGSGAGYLDLGGPGRSVKLFVRLPTVPDLTALCRRAMRKACEILPGREIPVRALGTAGLSGKQIAEVSEAFLRDRLGRPVVRDELLDVLESAEGASLIIWHAAGLADSGLTLALIREAVDAVGACEALDRLDGVTAVPDDKNPGRDDMTLTWQGLLVADAFTSADWAKIYRGMNKPWNLLPHEIDAYSVPRIMAMSVPDGKVTKEQFMELAEARRHRDLNRD